VNQKLEAVDKRNPSLVRAATLAEVNEYRLRIHFDGWDDIYDDWFEADSLDLYPVGWCEKTGHPLETPLSKYFVSKQFSEKSLLDWSFRCLTHGQSVPYFVCGRACIVDKHKLVKTLTDLHKILIL